jgi:hypothetical protein
MAKKLKKDEEIIETEEETAETEEVEETEEEEKEEIPEVLSERQIKFQKLINKYKVQNPKKYALKKEALEAQLKALK